MCTVHSNLLFSLVQVQIHRPNPTQILSLITKTKTMTLCFWLDETKTLQSGFSIGRVESPRGSHEKNMPGEIGLRNEFKTGVHHCHYNISCPLNWGKCTFNKYFKFGHNFCLFHYKKSFSANILVLPQKGSYFHNKCLHYCDDYQTKNTIPANLCSSYCLNTWEIAICRYRFWQSWTTTGFVCTKIETP